MTMFSTSKFNPRNNRITPLIGSGFEGRQNLIARKNNLVAAPAVKPSLTKRAAASLKKAFSKVSKEGMAGAMSASLQALKNPANRTTQGIPVVLGAAISGYITGHAQKGQVSDAQTSEELGSAASGLVKLMFDAEPSLSEAVDLINYKAGLPTA